MKDICLGASHRRIPLSQVDLGGKCIISDLYLEGILRRRVMDLGMIPGTIVECLRKGPSGDPTAYKIRGTIIALRKEDAARINVCPLSNSNKQYGRNENDI